MSTLDLVSTPVATRMLSRPRKRQQQFLQSMYPTVMTSPPVVTIGAPGGASFFATRSDACGTTTGSATITDTSITAGDFAKGVSGTGIPAGSYVGTVTPGVGFLLSSQPGTQVDRVATATGSPTLVVGDGAQNIPYNDTRIKAVGGVPAVAIGQLGYYQNNILNDAAGGSARLYPRMEWEFDFDGNVFEFSLYSNNNYNLPPAFRIKVDGQYVTLTPKIAGTDWTVGSSNIWVKVDFSALTPARTIRRISIETVSMPFGGLNVGARDSVSLPARQRATRVMFVGDSITVGITSTYAFDTWAQWCARSLGWDEVFINAIGGSGYLNPGSGYTSNAGQNIYDRRETIKALSPDIIVLAAGVNDTSTNNAAYTQAALQAQVALLLADLAADSRTANTLIYIVGPFRGSSFPISAALLAAQTAVLAAATAAQASNPNIVGIFDPIAEAWVTGNGNFSLVSTTSPQGNSQAYLTADGLHPQPAGHEGYGRRAAQDIAATLGA